MLEGIRRYSGQVFLDGEDGMYLHAYDVADAWAAKLAEIRAAVVKLTEARWDAEQAVRDYQDGVGFTNMADVEAAENKRDAAAAALGALLAVAPEAEVAP